jgi:hypothetical protein
MSAVLTLRREVAPSSCRRTPPALPSELSAQPSSIRIDGLPSVAGFAALLGAFRSSGGTTRGDDLARLLADHNRGDYVSLARLIVAGEVFGFEWRKTLWIPMFQFDSHDLGVKQGARQVLAELSADFDGWGRAAWFANSNSWLGGHRPVDTLALDMPAVLDAARADRFIAAG